MKDSGHPLHCSPFFPAIENETFVGGDEKTDSGVHTPHGFLPP